MRSLSSKNPPPVRECVEPAKGKLLLLLSVMARCCWLLVSQMPMEGGAATSRSGTLHECTKNEITARFLAFLAQRILTKIGNGWKLCNRIEKTKASRLVTFPQVLSRNRRLLTSIISTMSRPIRPTLAKPANSFTLLSNSLSLNKPHPSHFQA